jgi:ribulose-bisphosphate carboxylase small chain
MFGCTDGSQVLKEVSACSSAFPGAYIRLVAFDANKQVQVAGFLVNRPQNAGDFQKPADRSL